MFEVLLVLRPYQNVKSIRQVIFVFVECPKSIASEVLVVLMSSHDVKPIRQVVFKISRSQAIVDGRTDRRTGPDHYTSRLSTGV